MADITSLGAIEGTDVTAEILAALALDGEAYFPAGDWYMSPSTITAAMISGGVGSFRGAGSSVSSLIMTAGYDAERMCTIGAIVGTYGTGTPVASFTITNLTVDGNSAGRNSTQAQAHTIFVSDCLYFESRDCVYRDAAGDSVYLYDCRESLIEDCFFTDLGRVMITGGRGNSNMTVRRCDFITGTLASNSVGVVATIDQEPSGNIGIPIGPVHIYDCLFDNNVAISAAPGAGTYVDGVIMDNCHWVPRPGYSGFGGPACNIVRAKNVTVTNCSVHSTDTYTSAFAVRELAGDGPAIENYLYQDCVITGTYGGPILSAFDATLGLAPGGVVFQRIAVNAVAGLDSAIDGYFCRFQYIENGQVLDCNFLGSAEYGIKFEQSDNGLAQNTYTQNVSNWHLIVEGASSGSSGVNMRADTSGTLTRILAPSVPSSWDITAILETPMPTIDQIVQVTISASTSQPSQRGFGTPLILGTHSRTSNTVDTYSSLSAMVSDGFTVDDPLYKMASAIFSQSPRPPQIKVGRDTSAIDTTFTVDFSGSTAGTIGFTLVEPDGTEHVFTETWATSATASAAALAATVDAVVGLDASAAGGVVTVSLTTAGDYFFIKDVSTGVAAGYVLETTADRGYDTLLNSILNEDPNFYAVMALSNSDANIDTIATWVNANKRLGLFGPHVGDPGDFTATADALMSGNNDRVASIPHRAGREEFIEAAWAGRCLPNAPGSQTWSLQELSGPVADSWTDSEITTLEADNSNYYTNVAGLSITRNGVTHGGEYIDVTRSLDWLTARIQERIFAVLVNAKKIPYTDSGVQMIANEVRSQLLRAEVIGVLEPGSSLVTVTRVADLPTADRAARLLSGISFSGRLAGAVHTVQIEGNLTV